MLFRRKSNLAALTAFKRPYVRYLKYSMIIRNGRKNPKPLHIENINVRCEKMLKKWKGMLSVFICVLMLCTVMPITGHAADNAASVTFNGNTDYYTTIDDAWNAAVALDTTAENKATIKLLTNCKTENTLTNTADYLVLDTNGKTLTTPDAIYSSTSPSSVTCGICVEGGSLELIGGGTITGVSRSSYGMAILLINGGKVTANGITIHNTGTNGSNPVRIDGGEFYLIDSHLITDDEYALYAAKGKVYLYSGTLETGKTARMVTVNGSGAEIQICYSEQPLYFVMRRPIWRIIDDTSYVHLEDNLVMDLEYSDNPDGSDSKMIRNVTQIDDAANVERSYLKIQTYKPSYLFSTNYNDSLLKKVKTDGITTYSETEITAVHFVNLADYDLTDVTCSDYSAKGDGSVKAWMDGTELYIGGYRKIIAGRSLNCAFRDGKSINSITGLDLLDTSRTTDMGYVFNNCGYNSSEFTLDLGDNFDTSNATTMVYMFGSCGYSSTKFSLNLRDEFDTSKVTDMSYMFNNCGRSSPTFTLDLGDRFDTSNVTTMYRMFGRCGYSSTAFTTLDLSTFRVNADTDLSLFAEDIPVTKFIFGRGWRNATVAMKYNKFANSSSDTPTEIVGATKNLLSYDWASNNRTVTFTDNVTYTITALAEGGGWVDGAGTVLDGESITLTAVPAPNGYSLEGWYDGDTKVCDTEEFVIEDASDDKTYTAKFIQTTPYYSISARVKDSGGQVSGSDDVPEGGSVTLIATPDDGYTFEGWYDGDTKVCDTEEFVVSNVTENKTYTARFARIIVYYTISAEVGESGGGTVSGGGKVEKGSNVTLTATPDDGYSFVGWYDGTTRVATTKEYTVKNVKADKTYTAKFSKIIIYYTISAEVGTEGGSVSGGGTVTEGGSITLTATANDGYTFDGWYDGDTKVCETEEFVVENVTANKTYTAKFTEKTAVVSKLFNTEYYGTLLNKIKYDGVTDVKEDEITGVHFVDLTDYELTDITYSDYSASGDGSVKAWMDGTELYIGGYGKIIAGRSLVYAFRTGGEINSITGLEMLDTSNVTDMSQMFQSCGSHSAEFTLDLGNNFNTSNVTRMKDMFEGCGRESTKFTLNLGDNFDTSNVYDMSGLFHNCGYNSTVFALDLGEKFDTSNVINMSDMFNGCGAKSTVFTLDLGEKFDTSNVTNMKSMFRECGYSSTKFTFSLGDKFDTSKVTDMSYMFYRFGDESEEFTLDLGDHFDTSNVENMTYMFYACGYRSPVFKLNFRNKFNTSKVTDMSFMFAYTGCYSKEFNLALDDRFDTSNVTDITAMFLGCGSESETFTLDLGNHFDTSKVIDGMALMFQGCGETSKVFTLDLGDKFDTSNVTDMRNMFYRCGFKSNVFTLDLGDKFNTSKVTDMGGMFGYCGFNSTAFTTLDLSSFTIGAKTDLRSFATYSPVTEFIFGEGWANASLPTKGAFYSYDKVDTTVTGATKNLLNYNWTNDRRTVTFPDKNYYTITALADDGGTVTGGGTVVESSSITLTASANDGYTFDGWYDGDTKVCDTTEFVVSNVNADKTYTAKFTKNAVYYTISAEVDANGGGTVSGGGEVAAGGSITLTATVNDGYTFAGWYDGDTKVCDTAEFVVTNVAADKTYTAKFTKNQVAPEPEEPEIPYLKWDGSTLTLVKKTSASCRVGIVYVGGATFDADNINWDKLVSAGKEYANLNSAVGYAVYSNFTKRTPGTRGNYVAFVKYTKDDGTTTADYITFNVKDAVSFEIPSLSYNVKTKTLKLTGDVSSTIGVAYVGDAEFNASNLNWNDFIKAGKQYTDVNGSSGYAKVLNTLDYTKTFTVNGNYVAFVKYNDENINKTLAKYYTFTVSDYEPQPEDVPYVSAQDNKIVLAASRLEVAKVTIAYIGTDDIYITNWSEFSAAAAKFSDINGKALNQQYTNPKDGSAWKQKLTGWYAVYIRYIKDGEKCNSYYTVELN